MSTIRPFRLLGRPRAGVAAAILALALGTAVTPGVAGAQGPGVPGHLTPNVGDGSPAFTDVLLGWSSVSGATSYEIQVSDTADFSADVLTGSSTTTTWPLPATVPAADYMWRVRAVTASGAGAWSGAASFTHSWEVSPEHVRVLPGAGAPTVAWDTVPGASFYEVEFSTTPYVDENVMQDKVHRYTCYTQHPYLAPYGTALGNEALPGDETTCAFATTGKDPRLDSLTSALKSCDDAGGTADEHALCVAKAKEAFDEADPLADKQFFPLVDHDGNAAPWYVRVRARNGTLNTTAVPFAGSAIACTGVWHNADGTYDPTTNSVSVPIPAEVPYDAPTPECSSWSDQLPFFVAIPGAVRDIANPVAGAAVQPAVSGDASATPLFTWPAVPGATKYRVYLGRTRDLRSADHVWETTATSILPYGTIRDALRYYWGVQACGWYSCGPVVPMSFTKTATSPVRALTAKTTPLDATLTWRTQTDATIPAGGLVPATDSEAEAYQVELHRVRTAWPATPVTVDAARLPGGSTATSTTTLPLGGLADGTYEWRVRAIDQSGFPYPWSLGGAFLRDVTAPTARLAMQPGFSPTQALRVTFSEPVSVPAGAISVRDSAGAQVAGSVRGAGTSWTFVPAKPWTTGGTYTFAVAGATDRAGNRVLPVSSVVRAATVADTSAVTVTRTGEPGLWSTRTASDARGGSYLRTAVTAGVSLRTVLVGSSVAVVACRSPHSGAVAVSVDGRTRATLDLYRSYSGCGTVWSTRVARGQHTVAVAPVRSRNSRTDGSWVGIDAIATS